MADDWKARLNQHPCSNYRERALAMEGARTGEHGIGQDKKHFIEPEHGAPAVALMRTLKPAIEPDNIMNPGKIVKSGPHENARPHLTQALLYLLALRPSSGS